MLVPNVLIGASSSARSQCDQRTGIGAVVDVAPLVLPADVGIDRVGEVVGVGGWIGVCAVICS